MWYPVKLIHYITPDKFLIKQLEKYNKNKIRSYNEIEVAVITKDVANENPANQSADGKHNDQWNEVTRNLVSQLLDWSLSAKKPINQSDKSENFRSGLTKLLLGQQ